MSVVKDNSTNFVDTLHDEESHLGAVSYFDSSYSVGSPRKDPSEVKNDISSLSTGGNTALYDSILDSMNALRRAQLSGEIPLPALLLTFTDGKENESDATLNDVQQRIEEIGFVPQNQCYFAIAGIGDASQQELRDICADGRGLYTHTDDDIRKAFGLFIAATIAVIKGKKSYRSIRQDEQKLTIEQLEERFQAIGRIPLQYMLNIDTSGSMGNSP